ncbi:4-hydroxy-tetrahydrodipicolinate synthase [Brachybacterium halotolerans subsp. kimchii]|uniref:4-hydroxy-tetrahydrodipicolinate synthase n=1 Tax=Brachybacterium halotolerans TaxID=2795215 RepID=UPI001E5071A7|nr:4-hydroxy-tetrahydrodipicolinate synthase [Brachybacterium halotolerans]UEJ83692.1 4-hydroxy-tetrahydrodipicolinate synthase [Brachybacterium halotolerans subsp. kimchii]
MTVQPAPAARPFGTVGTAMVTPFTEDGEKLDLDAAQAVAAHLVAHGNDCLVVNGTTGESPTTSDAEKIALVRAVREAVGPGITLLAGVGSNDTRHSIELARAHADLDLQGLLVVTPYYSKPSQDGIIAHTEQVADATELPILLYDIPGRSGVPLAHETLLRLAQHERILAVKDAKGDLQQAALVTAQSDLVYYSGEDALNLAWLAVGAAGIVSVVGHVAGELEAQMVAAVQAGDLPAAQQLNRRLAPVVEAVMTRMPGAVAAKTALVLQGVLPHATVRGPLAPASAPQMAELRESLAAVEGIPPLV